MNNELYCPRDFGFQELDYEGADPLTLKVATAVREWMVRRIGRNGETRLSGGGCTTFMSPLGSHGTSHCGGVLHIHYDGGDLFNYLSCDGMAMERGNESWRMGPDSLDSVIRPFGLYAEDYSGWATVLYRI